jgi:Uncharacterised protein family (UPF0158)
MTLTLPNGKPIDKDMLEVAMEDSDLCHSYYLNVQTGEVAWFSEYDGPSDEKEQLLDEIDSTHNYIAIEHISSHEAYQWMEDFVAEIVEPKDERVAEKLSIALMGKGAFRRFKDILHRVGDEWVQAWYQWKGARLDEAITQWLADESLTITDE